MIDRFQSAAATRIGWRLLAALAVALVTGVLTAGPASAHNALQSSNPADGAVVERMPAEIVLTFAEPAIAMGTQILIAGPSGEVQRGDPRLVDNTVTQRVGPGAPAGAYTIVWRVTSIDGHPISGKLAFTVQKADGGSSTPAPPKVSKTEPRTGPDVSWAVIVGLVIVVGVSLLLALRARRRRTPAAPD